MRAIQLFSPEPVQWGLRGDPHLWREMKAYFEDREMPPTVEEFREQLLDVIVQLTGALPLVKENIFVSRYPTLGMSGGIVSGRFWVEKGIPMLLERYAAHGK
jgi:hypothetical protein